MIVLLGGIGFIIKFDPATHAYIPAALQLREDFWTTYSPIETVSREKKLTSVKGGLNQKEEDQMT